MLAQVVHDWPDEDAVRILGRCADALRDGTAGRVVLVERIVADHAPELGHTAMDLRMLVLFGSAERTREEFTDLAGRAGLKITDTRTAGLGLSLITCTLAGTAG